MSIQLPSLAGKPLPCFTCRFDKRPTTPHAFKDGTSDPEAFEKLSAQYPGTLIGVPTGAHELSPNLGDERGQAAAV